MAGAPRRRLVAGNWKMNGTLAETRALLSGLSEGWGSVAAGGVEVAVLPPFTALSEARARIDGSGASIALGAQDLHWEPRGAFTGEVSGAMLRDFDCVYVLVGHSERRHLFGEAGDLLLRKTRAALDHGLVPIYCVGERLEERESGRTNEVLDQHLEEVLLRLPDVGPTPVVLAYEPVWAIGTGRVATPDQAEDAHRHLRERVAERLGREAADAIRILYGGSVTAANARGLFERPGIDGALVGGSSLKAAEFLGIIRAAGGGPDGP